MNLLRHRFRVLGRQMDVRMLIVDEIHTMLAGTFREQRVFLNSITQSACWPTISNCH